MSETPKSAGPVAPELLADLAAASRILAARGVVDGFGHVSMRHPGSPDRFLMSKSIAPALVVPDDIIEYDLNSEPVTPTDVAVFLKGSFMVKSIRHAPISIQWFIVIRHR